MKDTSGLKFLARIAKADRKERGVLAKDDFRVNVRETFEEWKTRTGYTRADLYEKERKKMFWRARAMKQNRVKQRDRVTVPGYMPRG